ncbi:MAG: type II/IV secretion system ATPase subunit [Methanocorpusculum sp.]|nr:type II/IV secretion system ATPase subunit [Methanocorpusculum sp.]
MPDTDKPKEKKTFSSLFAKKETNETEPKEKKTLSSLFAKKETDGNEPKKSLLSLLMGEKPVFEEPPQVLELPPFETEFEVVDRYWLTPPYAYANLYRDEYGHVHYQMVEPKLTEKELVVLEESYEQLKTVLVYDEVRKRGEFELDREVVREIITGYDPKITPERRDTLLYYLNRNTMGYGRLDALLHDERIEDITCNGANIPLFLYHRRFANVQTDIVFDANELNKYVLKLAQKADKQISLTTPLIDAALPEGSRAQITYSDIVSAKGSSFTIRKFKADPMTPADLVGSNTYSAELMAHLWLAVENNKSMIIAGGTASGKTSTMNAASFFIPSVAKIVSIEDTREIQLPHSNWLAMKTRESLGSQGAQGNISMFTLLKAALRQRPEYIIVGEVRGEEAQTLFQAMNTGHTTYSTLHAGNVKEAINRLINDPINVPVAMFGALNLVLVQSLLYGDGKGFRRCLSLNELIVEEDKVSWKPLFVWNNKTDKFDKVYTRSAVFDNIAYQNNWTDDELAERLETRRIALENMANSGKTSVSEVDRAIIETRMKEREN